MKIIERRSGDWSPELTSAERETLYSIALDTLSWCTAGKGGTYDFGRYPLTPVLETPFATFVTLHAHGMLRGCIGSLEPQLPLFRSVHENARGAALHDPRFPAVSPREVPTLAVDVSILSAIHRINDLAEFRLGEHGIILEKGWQRAVFLPEVAIEQDWTVEQTLSALCQKAGLPNDAWHHDCCFKVFSSVVLSTPSDQGE